MAIKVDDYLAKLPKKRQQAIAKRAAELIAEKAAIPGHLSLTRPDSPILTLRS
ncbi:MAG: hypothetical protein ACLQU5_22435 [Isosphaeraceae bacterium]|jgi:hypothetical protein